MCTQGRIALTADDQAPPVRVCDQCMVWICDIICSPFHNILPNFPNHIEKQLVSMFHKSNDVKIIIIIILINNFLEFAESIECGLLKVWVWSLIYCVSYAIAR